MTDREPVSQIYLFPMTNEELDGLWADAKKAIFLAGAQLVITEAWAEGWLETDEQSRRIVEGEDTPLAIVLEALERTVSGTSAAISADRRRLLIDRLNALSFLEDTHAVQKIHNHWGIDISLSREGELQFMANYGEPIAIPNVELVPPPDYRGQ